MWSYIYGGVSNLGAYKYIFLGLILAAIATGFAQKWRRKQLLPALWILLLCMVIFSINALYSQKTPFLGGAFFGTFIYGSCFTLSCLLKRLLDVKYRTPAAVTASCVLGASSFYLYTYPPVAEINMEMAKNNDEVLHKVNEQVFSMTFKNPKPILLYTHMSPLVPAGLRLEGLRHNMIFQERSIWTDNGLEPFYKSLNGSKNYPPADIIICQDEGARGVVNEDSIPAPADEWQDEMRDALFSDPHWKYLGKVESGMPDKFLYTFVRKDALKPLP